MAQQLLSKNLILTGVIDHFCLACVQHLQGENDLAKHIADSKHRTALHSVQYIEELVDDGISKVPFGLFCEYCNVYILCRRHLDNHLASEYHHRNKAVEELTNARRMQWGVLINENLFFTDESWQGLHDKFCVLCKTRYENVVYHANHPVHKLNLILKRVQIDQGDNYYRRIDETYIYCIICSLVIKRSDMAAHFSSLSHQDYLGDWYEAASQLLGDEDTEEKLNARRSTVFQRHNPSLSR